jgi:hypothetical protein
MGWHKPVQVPEGKKVVAGTGGLKTSTPMD